MTPRNYHNETSYQRGCMRPHFLDWQNQPAPFKHYPLPSFPLPGPRSRERTSLRLSRLFEKRALPLPSPVQDAQLLSDLLDLTLRVTAPDPHAPRAAHFRSAPSAGALHPTELYVCVEGWNQVQDGLYHVSIVGPRVTPLREGAFSRSLGEMVPGAPPLARLWIFATAIFYRSAWKYRDRAYRYHLLDTGHVLENLSLALIFSSLPGAILYDFDDASLNRFLGLDPSLEAALAVCPVASPKEAVPSSGPGPGGPSLPLLPEKVKMASRLAPYVEKYPTILNIHEAGYGIQKGAIIPPSPLDRLEKEALSRTPLPSSPVGPEALPYPDVLQIRRSRRNFIRKKLSPGALGGLLRPLTRERHDENDASIGLPSLVVGVLAGAVEGLEPGFYVLEREGAALVLVRKGDMREEMARICLDQVWLSQAALHLVFFADLEHLEGHYGPRGYRYALMEAGRLGERVYLQAAALGFGCCGIGAFFDGEALELLGLEPPLAILYLVAVGPVAALHEGRC